MSIKYQNNHFCNSKPPFYKFLLRSQDGSSYGSATVSFLTAKGTHLLHLWVRVWYVWHGVCAAIWRPWRGDAIKQRDPGCDEGHMLHACAALGAGHVPSPLAL